MNAGETRARARTPNLEHETRPNKIGISFTQKRLTQFECRHDRSYSQAVTVLCWTLYIHALPRLIFLFLFFSLFRSCFPFNSFRSPRCLHQNQNQNQELKVRTTVAAEKKNGPRIAYAVATYFIRSTCARTADRFWSFLVMLLPLLRRCRRRRLLSFISFPLSFYLPYLLFKEYLLPLACRFCHCLCAKSSTDEIIVDKYWRAIVCDWRFQ